VVYLAKILWLIAHVYMDVDSPKEGHMAKVLRLIHWRKGIVDLAGEEIVMEDVEHEKAKNDISIPKRRSVGEKKNLNFPRMMNG
jgi:hypothetical protein